MQNDNWQFIKKYTKTKLLLEGRQVNVDVSFPNNGEEVRCINKVMQVSTPVPLIPSLETVPLKVL